MRKLAFFILLISLAPATWAMDSQNLDLLGCLPGEVWNFQVENDFAYCATRSGLLILDLAAGTNPQPVGFLPMHDDARGIAVRDGLAYLSPAYLSPDGIGLCIVDVSDPAAPVEIGSCSPPGGAGDLILNGDFAYLVFSSDRLGVFDISDSTEPTFVDFLDLPGRALDLELAGDKLYVAGDNDGLFVVDVGNPGVPVLDEVFDAVACVRGVAVRGSYAYISVGSIGMRILDLSGKEIELIGTCSLNFDIHYGTWSDHCAVSGDYCYAAVLEHGIGVVDISDPTAPVEVCYYELPGYARAISVDGDRAFLGCTFGGFCQVDVADPEVPVLDAHFGLLGNVRDLRIDGGMAYLAAGYAPPEEKDGGSRVYAAIGLHVLDLADSHWPELVAYEPSCYAALQIALSDGRAYIASYLAGTRIYDVTDPYAPVATADIYDMGVIYWEVEAAGDLAYLISDRHGLQIFDVSDPAKPVELSRCDEFYSDDIAVEGNYVYGANRWGGLQILDAGDPYNPEVVGHLDLDGNCHGVYVEGGRLYLAEGQHGLRVFDVSDVTAPFELGLWDSPGTAMEVFVSDGLAYLADYDSGVRVIDVSDPTAMVEVAWNGLPKTALAVEVAGDHVYVAGSWGGFYVLEKGVGTGSDPSAPTAQPFVLGRNYPNPFNPDTRIPFELRAESKVELCIYNVSGQLERRLVSGIRAEGHHLAVWDGRDDQGRALPSGVYLYSLECEGRAKARRLLLLK